MMDLGIRQSLHETARSGLACLYHEVPEKILSGEVDCGIILHETRFNFEALGLKEIVDFGKLWQMQHKCPLPLIEAEQRFPLHGCKYLLMGPPGRQHQIAEKPKQLNAVALPHERTNCGDFQSPYEEINERVTDAL